MEAVGNSQWFVGLLERLRHEVWIGDEVENRASYVRQQKTDRWDVGHILKLLLEGQFELLNQAMTEVAEAYPSAVC